MRFPVLGNLRPIAQVLVAVLGCLPSSATGSIVQTTDSNGVITLSQSKRPSKARSSTPEGRNPAALPDGPASRTTTESRERYADYIRQAAALYQIPEELVRAVISVESGYNPRATSPANAKGLMQLIPETAQRMQVEDVFDPRQNIFGGTRYLRILANLFSGDLNLTIAAYNAGEGSVLRYGGIPPYRETEEYVAKVVALYRTERGTRK